MTSRSDLPEIVVDAADMSPVLRLVDHALARAVRTGRVRPIYQRPDGVLVELLHAEHGLQVHPLAAISVQAALEQAAIFRHADGRPAAADTIARLARDYWSLRGQRRLRPMPTPPPAPTPVPPEQRPSGRLAPFYSRRRRRLTSTVSWNEGGAWRDPGTMQRLRTAMHPLRDVFILLAHQHAQEVARHRSVLADGQTHGSWQRCPNSIADQLEGYVLQAQRWAVDPGMAMDACEVCGVEITNHTTAWLLEHNIPEGQSLLCLGCFMLDLTVGAGEPCIGGDGIRLWPDQP